MSKNENLHSAKDAKNDEFYTQYNDIEAEMNAYVEFDPDAFRDKTSTRGEPFTSRVSVNSLPCVSCFDAS